MEPIIEQNVEVVKGYARTSVLLIGLVGVDIYNSWLTGKVELCSSILERLFNKEDVNSYENFNMTWGHLIEQVELTRESLADLEKYEFYKKSDGEWDFIRRFNAQLDSADSQTPEFVMGLVYGSIVYMKETINEINNQIDSFITGNKKERIAAIQNKDLISVSKMIGADTGFDYKKFLDGLNMAALCYEDFIIECIEKTYV